MVLVGIVLYPMAPIMNYSVKQLKDDDNKYDPNFYNFVEDLKYDNVISSSITCNNGTCAGDKTEISLTRLDGCKISYSYNSTKKEVSRSVLVSPTTCIDAKRDYKLINIDDFKINGGSFVSKNTNTTINTKTILITIESQKYNYSINYILYNKN